MRTALPGTVIVLLAGVNWAWAQPALPPLPAEPEPVPLTAAGPAAPQAPQLALPPEASRPEPVPEPPGAGEDSDPLRLWFSAGFLMGWARAGGETAELTGTRLTAGTWLDEQKHLGVEANFTALESSANVLPSAGLPTRLQGVEVNGLANVVARPSVRLDLLAGVRADRLEERVNLAGGPTGPGHAPGQPVAPAVQLGGRDVFTGGQVGLRSGFQAGRFSLEGTGKVGVGNAHENVDVPSASRGAGFKSW